MKRRKPSLNDYKKAIDSIEWLKLVAVGDVCTGKTTLIRTICQNTDNPLTDYSPTVGVDYGFKIHEVDENKKVRVHLWDLSGNQVYYGVRKELYAGTDILLLMFDITKPNTFNHLKDWIDEVTEFLPPPDQCPIISVVANKTDLNKDRRVSVMDGKRWSLENKLKYFEISAAKGFGVDKMMAELVKNVLENRRKRNDQ